MATGLAPDVLVGLDDDWLHALRLAAAERWSAAEELLALVAELLHAQLRLLIQAYTKDGAQRRIEPLRVPRPGERAAPVRKPSAAEVVRFFRGGG